MAAPAPAESNAWEAVLSQELMEAMPGRVKLEIATKAQYATGQILLMAMKLLLPSEEIAKVSLLNQVEHIRDPPRTLGQLVEALQRWIVTIQVLVGMLGGIPDATRVQTTLTSIVDPFRNDPSLGFEIGMLYNRYNLHRTQPVRTLVQYVAEVRVAATQRGTQQKQQDFLVKEQGRSRPQPQVAAKVAEVEQSYDQPEYGMEETDGTWSQGPTESEQAWWNTSTEQDGTYQFNWESDDWSSADPVAQLAKKGKPKGTGKGITSTSSGGNPPSAASKGKGKKPSSSSGGNCRA